MHENNLAWMVRFPALLVFQVASFGASPTGPSTAFKNASERKKRVHARVLARATQSVAERFSVRGCLRRRAMLELQHVVFREHVVALVHQLEPGVEKFVGKRAFTRAHHL